MNIRSVTKRAEYKIAGKLDQEGIGPGVIVSFGFVTEVTGDIDGKEGPSAEEALQRMADAGVRKALSEKCLNDTQCAMLVRFARESVAKVVQRDEARSSRQDTKSPVRKTYPTRG